MSTPQNDKQERVKLHCPYQPCSYTAETMTAINGHVCLCHQQPHDYNPNQPTLDLSGSRRVVAGPSQND